MNRKLLLFIALLACLALPLGHLAAQDDVPTAPAVADASFLPAGEPNDTFATATTLSEGYLTTPSDVDFIRLEFDRAVRLDSFQVYLPPVTWDVPPRARVQIALYNGAQALVAQDVDCAEPDAELPPIVLTDGVYYVQVQVCPGAFDSDQLYFLGWYQRFIEQEPNNTRATANPWADVDAAISPAGDVDFYRLEGTAGQEWHAIPYQREDNVPLPEVAWLAADGALLAYDTRFVLPADGVYYVRVRSASHPTGSGLYRVDIFTDSVEDARTVEEIEPNNTPAQGQMVAYGNVVSGEATGSDVDYFRFNAQAGDAVALANPYVEWQVQVDGLRLYGPAMQPITLNGWANVAELPQTGVYTIAKSWTEYRENYRFELARLGAGEPANDTQAGAVAVPNDQRIVAAWDYPCDEDWYRFEGRAGDVFPIIYPSDILMSDFYWLYAPDGTRLDTAQVLPADGTYYLRVLGDWWDDDNESCNHGPYGFTPVSQSLWVSASVNGLGGTANEQGDIVVRGNAPGTWRTVFDASDVGIVRDVVAFEAMPNGTILMSLDAAQNVPGLGKVRPQDIIRFVPTSLGTNTAGMFLWFLDGSDVGLTTTSEKIDAIVMQPSVLNPLIISLSGSGSVPRQGGGTVTAADEDLIVFIGAEYGANTAGAWHMKRDGSDVPGMAAEDLVAAERLERYPARLSRILWGFADSFVVNGIAGGPKDVLYSDGLAVRNLAAKPIDAIAIGPAR